MGTAAGIILMSHQKRAGADGAVLAPRLGQSSEFSKKDG